MMKNNNRNQIFFHIVKYIKLPLNKQSQCASVLAHCVIDRQAGVVSVSQQQISKTYVALNAKRCLKQVKSTQNT